MTDEQTPDDVREAVAKPDQWARCNPNEFHSKSSAYAVGYERGWGAALSAISASNRAVASDQMQPSGDVREAVAQSVLAVECKHDGPCEVPDGETCVAPEDGMAVRRACADVALSAIPARPTVSAEQVWAIADGLRKRLSVSNGTQVWVEYQGSAEELADMIAEIVKEE